MWSASGLTPEATVVALLSSDIKRLGPASIFVREAPGVYGLNPNVEPLPTRVDDADEGADELTFLDAAEFVLSEYGDRQPMHYMDITNKALELGVLSTKGRTPDATMYAQIVTDVNKAQAAGGVSRFTKLGRGVVGLTEWEGIGINQAITQHNNAVKEALLASLLDMDPQDFEQLAEQVLAEMGFQELEITQYSGDKGIDVRGTLLVAGAVPVRMAVQVKRWKAGVGAPEVQKVRGASAANENPLIITTSAFTKAARNEAVRPGFAPVGLIDGKDFVELMVRAGVGVRKSPHDVIDLEDRNTQTEIEI